MTVYVTQQPKPNNKGWLPNLEPAKLFGPLRFVFQGDELVYCNPIESMEKAEIELLHFNSDEDYILWPYTGDPAAGWAVVMTLVGLGHEEITFLMWERNPKDENGERVGGFYSPVTLKLTKQGNKIYD